MTNTETQTELRQLLTNSRGFRLLVSTYQQALLKTADSGDSAQQRALAMIIRREKPSDLQSVYFTEDVLQNFVEKNLGVIEDPAALLSEYREKAKQLIRSFLFLTAEDKNEILPYIDSLDLNGVKKMINLYKLGHHKQDQYLRTFAEKDPKMAIKFELIASGAHQKMRAQMSADQTKA